MISTEDYLYFLDQTLDGMLEIITRLGDDHVNQRLDLPSANSPYAILTHCLGVMDYWAGHVVAGRDVRRDRDAEFRAAGTGADLLDRVHQARRQLKSDLSNLEPFAPPRMTPPGKPSQDKPRRRPAPHLRRTHPAPRPAGKLPRPAARRLGTTRLNHPTGQDTTTARRRCPGAPSIPRQQPGRGRVPPTRQGAREPGHRELVGDVGDDRGAQSDADAPQQPVRVHKVGAAPVMPNRVATIMAAPSWSMPLIELPARPVVPSGAVLAIRWPGMT